MIKLLKLTSQEGDSKIQECVNHFTDKTAYKELGHLLYEFYRTDKLKDAIQYLAKGNDWETLTSLAHQHPDMNETVILPAIKLEANLRTNFLIEKINDFQTKYSRLQVVQENKRLMPNIIGEGGNLIDSDATSEFSEVSGTSKKSGASGATVNSRSSKKSKAPKNLLKRKVKEGSVLEEEWLIGNMTLDKFTDKIKGNFITKFNL